MAARKNQKKMTSNPFDWITAISQTKTELMNETTENQYNAFMVNKGLSYFPDTILYTNEMNCMHYMDNRLQFDYLINSIRSRKRFLRGCTH